MAVLKAKRARAAAETPTPLTIADLVLLRIAAGGASRAELQRDLAAIVAPKVPGTAFRRAAELAIGTHTAAGLLSEIKGRLAVTVAGARAVDAVAHVSATARPGWDGARDALVARALVLAGDAAVAIKAAERAESLAALVLQQHFGLTISKVLSTTDLRAELAVVALERAFGNRIKTGLGKGSGLPGKAGRLLAGQLFKSPREAVSDGKLILALAADVLGTNDQTLDGLKLALLRRLMAQAEAVGVDARSGAARVRAPAPVPANDLSPLPLSPPQTPRPRVSPDMGEFSDAVLQAARPVAEGWPGNRKAFISRVWRAIRNSRPDWELSEIAFKSMLAEAHRSGKLELTSADLKDKCDLSELEGSKILYKNTVWHFVRVED